MFIPYIYICDINLKIIFFFFKFTNSSINIKISLHQYFNDGSKFIFRNEIMKKYIRIIHIIILY